MVLVDSKGNEYTTKAEFKVKDTSFSIEIIDVKWEGFWTKFSCKVNIGEKHLLGHIKDGSFKIVSLRANDGSVVRLRDDYKHDMIGKTVEEYMIHSTIGGCELQKLYFNLKKMPIDPEAPPTILTLKVEGPEGVVKSAELEIKAVHREFILGLRVDSYKRRAWDLIDWTLRASNADDSSEILESGNAAIAFLNDVKGLASQVGDPKLLSKYLEPITIEKIEMALEAIELLKKRLEDFNKFYKTNFVSPI